MASKIKIPNFKCLIAMPKGTSRTYYVPLYERPLIEALWKPALSADNPLRFQKIPPPPTGRRDLFCDDHRFTMAESLVAEYRRVKSKYAAHEGLFDKIFPGDTFVDVARRSYPDLFGSDDVSLEIEEAEDVIVDVDRVSSDYDITGKASDEPKEEDVAIPAEKPEPAKKTVKKAAKKKAKKTAAPTPPALSPEDQKAAEALQVLINVGEDAAAKMVAAGYRTVEDVAQTDPEELAEAIPGLGKNEAIKTVDHAVDLSLDESESSDDALEG